MQRRRLVLLGAAALAGCAAPPVLTPHPGLSEAVRTKSFRAYREVLLVPPRGDAGGIGPLMRAEFEALGYRVRLMDPARPLEPPQGTAFVVGADGWLLTCAHVIGAETVATITLAGRRLVADVGRIDRRADLALLKLREPLPAGGTVLAFRSAARPAEMGETVYTIGFPLSRLLGNSARMSQGLLSATAGLRDDPRELQVSAEVHPGNSGGPLLDRQGLVIGVVHRIINPATVQRATGGALPQNINFAIKAGPVLDFLKAAEARAQAGLVFDRALTLADAGRAVAKVQAGIAPSDAERRGQLLVVLGAASRAAAGGATEAAFTLVAMDQEYQELLFTIALPGTPVASVGAREVAAVMDRFRAAANAR